ncbi:acyltransferase domain-containing protein, partial [Streptomyces sp. NPDC058221]|uniref:acyltransferase domain-containing protein n=1 Tax=Streptomyces sp. NPDC058221 TaxID=3346388 RepID=UPI0036EC1D10
MRPSAVIGHSQGEIAAAYVAGALSLDDAARVVALRSRAIVALAGQGGMVSVSLAARELEQLLRRWDGRISIAALNGPGTAVVSGDVTALDELLAACESDEVRAKRVPVDYASHSAHVEMIEAEILDLLAPIQPRKSEVPFFSTVTGDWFDTAGASADYWYRNLRNTVRLEESIRSVHAQGHDVFVEVSAHPVLTMSIEQTLDAASDDQKAATASAAAGTGSAAPAIVLPSLRRDNGGMDSFLASVAEGHVRGVEVDWPAVIGGGRMVELPTYAFNNRRFWLEESGTGADVTSAGLSGSDHPLVGASVELGDGDELVLSGRISLRTHPWLADHAIEGAALLPGTALLELAVHAGDQVGCGHVDDLTLELPLWLPESTGVALQVVVRGADQHGSRPVSVYSRSGENWVRHASGTLSDRVPQEGARDESAWPPAGAVPVDLTDAYDILAERGYDYGPQFQGMTAVWRDGSDVVAEITLPSGAASEASRFGLHPALLDAALHPVVLGALGEREPGLLPFNWSGMTLHASGAKELKVRLSPRGAAGIAITAMDTDGMPVATVSNLTLRPRDPAGLPGSGDVAQSLYEVQWVPISVGASDSGALDSGSAPEESYRVHEATGEDLFTTLEAVRGWLLGEGGGGVGRLVVVTRGAVAAGGDGDVVDVVGAGVW